MMGEPCLFFLHFCTIDPADQGFQVSSLVKYVWGEPCVHEPPAYRTTLHPTLPSYPPEASPEARYSL